MFFHMMFTDMYVTVVEIATVTNIYTNAFSLLRADTYSIIILIDYF